MTNPVPFALPKQGNKAAPATSYRPGAWSFPRKGNDVSIIASHGQKADLAATHVTPLARARDRAEAIRALCGSESVVYACRLSGGIIKIGCSSRLDRRRRCIAAEAEVLGFIPGDFDDEAAIHGRLQAHVAHGREYYHPAPAVMAVVNAMRDRFNLPHLSAE